MTRESLKKSIEEHFGKIPDQRVVTRSSHKLVDIIAIAILAILCGADGWVAIETYGKAKEEWLSTFLELPNGIPSHDTFGRIFSQLDPEILEKNFQSWIKVITAQLGLEVVAIDIRRFDSFAGGLPTAIDGKSLNGSYDRENSLKSLVMVSAWSSSHRLVLGQVAVKQKSNEMQRLERRSSSQPFQGSPSFGLEARGFARLAKLCFARNSCLARTCAGAHRHC